MSLLDFIKNRQSQHKSTAPQAQPETAKQMYTREASQERAAAAPDRGNMRPDQRETVKNAQKLFQQGTEPSGGTAPSPQAPSDGATSPQPMAQLSMSQDKTAPALSPTSAQQGQRSNEQGISAQESSSKSPEQTPRTMARTTPSWER